tara:strand:+ start:125 stop:1804 length:1680 start_codon:yes stop_codon:yes gene_type:complete
MARMRRRGKLINASEARQEILKCAQSVSYLGNHYCYIRTVTGGRVLFKTWPFQDICLETFRSKRFTIVNKSRQIGLSTIVALYILWRMMFLKDQHIIIMAIKEKTAKELFQKVTYMYKYLPDELKLWDVIDNNKRTWSLANESRLEVLPKGADATRSAALSLLVIDEASHIEGMNGLWIASQPSMETGGDVITLSTPAGAGENWFYNKFKDGKTFWDSPGAEAAAKQMKLPPFFPLQFDWTHKPGRDEQWKIETIQDLHGDKRMFMQEYGCSFLGSSDTFIEPDLLTEMEEEILDPIESEEFLYIWEHVRIGQEYIISSDVALGAGRDFSTAQVLCLRGENWIQVAELRLKVPTDIWASELMQLSDRYNHALLVVERNNVGIGTVNELKRILLERNQISRMYFDVKDERRGWVPWYMSIGYGDWQFEEMYEQNKIKLGYRTDQKTRQRNLLEMSHKLRDGTAVVRSRRLYDEFLNFRLDNFRRPDHSRKSHDDLIIAYAIGLSICEERAPFTDNASSEALLELGGLFSVDTETTSIAPGTHGDLDKDDGNFWDDQWSKW